MNQNSDLSKRLLLIVDPQVDFITGTLVVPGAEKTMKEIGEYLRQNGDKYARVVITADWHPANHISFSDNGGQWPAHCVQFSEGAAITDDVYLPAVECCSRLSVLTKGTETPTDEYSIFANAVSSPQLCKMVVDNDLEGIDVCGIAGDVCVANTVKDAVKIFGNEKVRVLEHLCASLDDGSTLKYVIESNNLQ